MSDKTLGYLLSKTKPGKNKAASKLLLLKDNPYSQALLALKGKGDFTNKNIHYKYDWYQSKGTDTFNLMDDALNIGVINLSKKKKKKSRSLKTKHNEGIKTETLSDLKALITDQTADEEIADISKVKSKKKLSKKKKKSKKKCHRIYIHTLVG